MKVGTYSSRHELCLVASPQRRADAQQSQQQADEDAEGSRRERAIMVPHRCACRITLNATSLRARYLPTRQPSSRSHERWRRTRCSLKQ